MFRIIFEAAAGLRGIEQGEAILSAIHFDFDDGAFPLPDRSWFDRVHPNMRTWIEECGRLVDGAVAVGFIGFTEGPFGVFLEPLSETQVQFRCVYGGARQHPEFFTGDFSEVVRELERASLALDRACADNGFVVTPCAPLAADVRRRFEQNGNRIRLQPSA